MVEQILFSPQVKRNVIISTKLVYNCRITRCRTTQSCIELEPYAPTVHRNAKYRLAWLIPGATSDSKSVELSESLPPNNPHTPER